MSITDEEFNETLQRIKDAPIKALVKPSIRELIIAISEEDNNKKMDALLKGCADKQLDSFCNATQAEVTLEQLLDSRIYECVSKPEVESTLVEMDTLLLLINKGVKSENPEFDLATRLLNDLYITLSEEVSAVRSVYENRFKDKEGFDQNAFSGAIDALYFCR